ncbi:MAG: 2,4-dienoyl-CoA reductase, partial [Ilumatobacteraceae bacterium]
MTSRGARLLEPLDLGLRTARNRVLFGPHVTNLGDEDRRLTHCHTAYYGRRARGGCGTIVVEGASVHESDWPYERAPLAERCADGWSAIAAAGHDEGALVLASLDHAGGQGSSAYSQLPLWAPSRVPEVASREVPKWMEADDIAAVVSGFGTAAKLAVEAGCDGVEVNAGQHSLVRQFLSGLTNQRDDEWGGDRLRFARDVLATVRAAVGPTRLVVLRLACDELAPWAGITPEQAPGMAAALIAGVDALVVVRGAIFSVEQTRPDFHQPPGFNIDLAAMMAETLPVPVFVQGSLVDVDQAALAIDRGCAGVEMTRAQIADPDLVAKVRAGHADRIRPCTRCNQVCQVRDARNPLVTCIGEPSAGRETEDPDWTRPTRTPRSVAVVGGGPAGLET